LQAWANSLGSRPNGTVAFAEKFRNFQVATPWFHHAWYAAMDDPKLERIFIQGPRYHAKTSTILTHVTRRICEDHHLRVGILSQTDGLAKHFLAEVKHELQSNIALRETYNNNQSFVGDTWNQHEIVLADARSGPQGITGKDVSVFSVSRGAQITGKHCDLLIVDDLESKESTDSDAVRQSTREWWAREVASVVVPGGKIIATGTRKHWDDMYSYWLKPNSGWVALDLVKSVFMPDGTPIWPEMWDLPALAAKKQEMDAQDLLAWPQEFLNEPRPSETQMFYPDRWPRYGKAPWGLTILQFWDLAISEKTTADFTVGFTIGVDERTNEIYLLEVRRGHWDFNRTLAEMADMGKFWSRPDASGTLAAIGIEAVAYQAAAVQEALRRTMLPFVPVVPDKDKVTRARLLEARAAAGKVLRPIEMRAGPDGVEHEYDPQWWLEFAAEALYFPAGAHDDQIDSLSGAVRLAGWQADSIAWQYGVWKCPKCDHTYMWEPGRPCPKCGTRAAETYENPELMSMGQMGSISSSGGNTPA
jgi:predicted phage terminase large subunit-like protein